MTTTTKFINAVAKFATPEKLAESGTPLNSLCGAVSCETGIPGFWEVEDGGTPHIGGVPPEGDRGNDTIALIAYPDDFPSGESVIQVAFVNQSGKLVRV